MDYLWKRNFVLLLLVLMIGSGMAYGWMDEPVYIATGVRTSDPGTDPNWNPQGGGGVAIQGGTTISIGCENLPDPCAVKCVKVKVSRIAGTADVTDISVHDPCAPGSKSKDGGVTIAGNYIQYDFDFYPQPEYETFQITYNAPAGSWFPAKITVQTKCHVATEQEKNEFKLLSNRMYYEGSVATIEIDKVAIWHDEKTTSDGSFAEPIVADPNIASDPNDPNSPTGTWTKVFIASDPNTGDPLPQGGWMWSCLPGDRGIWTAEKFDVTITTIELSGGRYWLVLHDRQRDEWVRFSHDQVLACDFNEDGIVNMHDFGDFAGQWLQTGPTGW